MNAGTYAFHHSLPLFLSRNHSRSHSRNTSTEKHSQSHIVHRATPYPRPTLHSKNTPGCLPVDKITAILYTVVFSPAFFHLLSRERYNIQFVGYVHARRRFRSTALLRPRARTRCSTYITLTVICIYIYICTYNSRKKFLCVCVCKCFVYAHSDYSLRFVLSRITVE